MDAAYRAARARAIVVRGGEIAGSRAWRGSLMLILDAGAFIAAERGSKIVVALIKREREHGRVPLSNGAVVAQVWRGGNGRQAPVAKLLASVEVIPVDDHLGRRAGCARRPLESSMRPCLLAQDGDDIRQRPVDADLARAAARM